MKKGFTLVELLAVITIITIIFVIVYPIVTDIIMDSENVVNNSTYNDILDAAYDYTLKNMSSLPENNEIKYITLNQLQKEGLIDVNIKDVIENEIFPPHLVISIEDISSSSKTSNELSKIRGNYLYTIEDIVEKNKPIIEFSGYSNSPIVINVNLGSEYEELIYTATSYLGENITDKVIKNIIIDSHTADFVDTSLAGIYYINYSVVDEDGNSSSSIVNLIITDTQSPKLNVPENETISSSITSYDLMEGVSCTDNSGECEIGVNGQINFGQEGKYIIEYIAKDPSGNTTNVKRVITIS